MVETPGRGPGGSRFESGRSPHRTAGDLGSARSHTPRVAGSITAPATTGPGGQPGSAAPLQGEGCGVDSGAVHHADVAQPGEARRSDRRQCRFESDRQYPPLDVAQRERTGPGSRGLGVRVSPSRPAANDDAPQPSRPDAQAGVPSPLKRVVAGSSPAARHHHAGRSSTVEHLVSSAAWFPGRLDHPVSCEGRASFLGEGRHGTTVRPPFDSAPLVRPVP